MNIPHKNVNKRREVKSIQVIVAALNQRVK